MLGYDSNSVRGLWALGTAYAQMGSADAAIAVHQRLAELAPAWRWVLGGTYARFGRRSEARHIAAELARQPANPCTAFGLASIHAALGENGAAFHWLAYERPHAWVPWARLSPDFAPLRDDPRFTEFLRRFGLPPVSGEQVARGRASHQRRLTTG